MRQPIGTVIGIAIALCSALTAPAAAEIGDLYVYPAHGQSDEQLGQDRFECHRWAVGETGFDPVAFSEQSPRIVKVPVPENPHAGATGRGAIAGGIIGGIIGASDDKAGRGAALGVVLGALIGGQVEEQGRRDARDQARREGEAVANAEAELALRRANYRRAMTACLEGRGYTVR